MPSYGKGLNKLTALTSVTTADEPHKDHLTVEDLVARAGGMSMQRSLSEGSGTFLVKVLSSNRIALLNKERRQSSGSAHSSRPKVRRPQSQIHPSSNKQNKQHVTFSTRHSSDDDDDDDNDDLDDTLVHRKSNDIVVSPKSHAPDHQHGATQTFHHVSPAPPTMLPRPPPQKSALKEGLAATPKFLQRNLSQVALVPPKVSMTNAVSKDLARPSTSAEQASYQDTIGASTGSSGAQIAPSSNPVSHFITSTPPSRAPRTPDLDMTSLHHAQSSATSFSQIDHALPPLTSQSHGKLTRTQQKLLLQRASTQPAALTTSYSSPSLAQTTQMEHATDYFSPLPATTAAITPGGGFVTMTYDVKVAREFERVSRELANARRFGDPVGDAVKRLQKRVNPATLSEGLNKKSSTFGLSVSWKRSPDRLESRGRTRVNVEDGVFGGEGRSRVREVMRRLWFDEVDVADVDDGTGRSSDDDEDDDEAEVRIAGSGFRGRRDSSRSQ